MAAVGGEMGSTTPTYAVLDLNNRLRGMALPEGGKLATGNLTWSDERPDLTQSPAVLLWQGEMRMMLDSYRVTLSVAGLYFSHFCRVLPLFCARFDCALGCPALLYWTDPGPLALRHTVLCVLFGRCDGFGWRCGKKFAPHH